jgi:hypothetical protein
MTPECKILFPDLPPYIVVFGPTVPGTLAFTISIDGYKETFNEYAPFYLRIADFDPEIKMTSREWKPGQEHAPKPQATEVTLYSNCENYVLEPDVWKRAALRTQNLIFVTFVRIVEFTRSANPYPGVPCKYEYKLNMEVFA